MTPLEVKVLATLRELDALVKSMPTAQPKPDLRPFFERLDQLATQLQGQEQLALRHFLERKSYEKARQHLEGMETKRGACGR
ncbi:MAG: hypothetical protein ACYDC1_18680 [Limisphaerales bacterium]